MGQRDERLLAQSEQIAQSVDRYSNEIRSLSRFIFAHPELGFSEFESSAATAGFLEKHGFSVEYGCADMKTAFRAVRHSTLDKKGPVIGFLCEYDALPDIGHACGHNIIAAGSAGAAVAAADFVDTFGGTIVVLGTPCEEGGGGKARLLKDGFMDDLDCAMMIHPGYKSMSRDIFTAISRFRITYHGKTAHASGEPQNGINALEAVLLLFRAVDGLRLHMNKDVSLHGIITKGGTATNMIPDLCEAVFALRTFTPDQQIIMCERLKNAADAAALATGCSVDFIEEGVGYECFRVNETLCTLLEDSYRVYGEKLQVKNAEDGFGSTDAGNVSQCIPTLHGMLGFGQENLKLHTEEFKAYCGSSSGEAMSLRISRCLGLVALRVMENPALSQTAWNELPSEKR